jgi:hypothetical protein
VIPVPGTFGLNAVNCTSPSYCLAVGEDNYTLFVNGQEGGSLGLPPNLFLTAMACPTSGNCFAVGQQYSPQFEGVVVPFSYGEPLTPIPVPGTLSLNGIACARGKTSCVAVGQNYNPGPPSSFQGAVVTLSNGSPSGAVQVETAFSTLGAVACTSATSCLAVGTVPGSPSTGGLLPVSNGVAGTAVPVSSVGPLSVIACATATSCWAAGGTSQVLPLTSGSPGTPVTVSGVNSYNAATCPTTTQCYLAGNLPSPGGGAVLPITSGVVGTPQTVLAPGSVQGISCVDAVDCVAVGYEPTSNTSVGVVITAAVQTPPATITSVAFSGSGYGETITVTGSNFGPWAPEASPPSPVSCTGGSPSYDYATGVLSFTDSTSGWSAGTPGSCTGLVVKSWSTTQVVFGFGTGYIWPLLASGDSYHVSVLGTSFSGTASIPPASAPKIKSVVLSGLGGSTPPTVTVHGAHLGTRIPIPVGSAGCVSGDTSDIYPANELFFTDSSQGWTGGESGDCLGLSVKSWSATKVVFTFGPFYPNVGAIAVGDSIQVGVLNAVFTGTASTTTPPTITSVQVTGTASAPSVTIAGSGFGASPPAPDPSTPITCVSGDTSFTYPAGQLAFSDTTQSWTAGETGDCVGLIVTSWSNTKVVYGFGADYANFHAVTKGDSIQVVVEGTTHTGTAGV